MMQLFLNLIGNLFAIKEFRLVNNQAKSEAISSIKQALRLTIAHISENRVGEFGEINFSDVQSKELVDAWSRAATAIRPFDKSIAETFEYKSDYWINPHQFRLEVQNQERRYDYQFRLTEVQKTLNYLENGGL